MSEKKIGWIGDVFYGGWDPDSEDRPALEATSTEPQMLMTGDLPERVDPRKHASNGLGFLQIEDQGQIGSCQGQSLTECGEFCYMLLTGLVIQFSRMYAYLCSQMKDGIRSDSGSTLNGGSKASETDGFCPEKDAPYPSTYPGWNWVTAAMRRLASPFKLRSHSILRTEQAVKQYIGSGIGIVQIGILWNKSNEPDRSGCIRNWQATQGGGHAVVLCGYVPDSDVGVASSRGYWYLLKNSWSKRWGIGGYAYVDPIVVEAWLRHNQSVFVGRSDLTVPNPRPIPHDFTLPGKSMIA